MAFQFPDESDKSKDLIKKIKDLGIRIKEHPDDLSAHRKYAEALTVFPNKPRSELALKSVKKILEEDENCNDVDSLRLLIRCYRLIGDLDSARDFAQKFSDQFPNTSGFKEELGRVHIENNNLDLAKDTLLPAFQRFPNDKRLARALILYYERMGETESALSLTSHQIKLDPTNFFLLQSKMIALWDLGRTDQAISFGEEIQEKFPDVFYQAGWNLQTQHFSSLSYRLSLFYYFKAKNILKNERHLNWKIKNGKITFENDLTSEAKTLLEKANDLCFAILEETNYSATQDNIKIFNAKILHNLTKFEESLILLNEISSELDLDCPWMKVKNLFYLGRFSEAIKICEKALSDYPNHQLFNKTLLSLYVGAKKPEEYDQLKKKLEANTYQHIDKNESNKTNSFDKKPFSIDHDDPYGGFRNYLDMLHSVGDTLRILNPHLKRTLIDFLHDHVSESSQIKRIELLGGHQNEHDKGEQFFKNYRGLKRTIDMFNRANPKCKLVVRVFLGDDKLHARYVIGDKDVWLAPGYDQVIQADGDEVIPLEDTRAKKVRKDVEKLWAGAIPLRESSFDNLLKRYVEVILKGKDACENINAYLNRKNNSL